MPTRQTGTPDQYRGTLRAVYIPGHQNLRQGLRHRGWRLLKKWHTVLSRNDTLSMTHSAPLSLQTWPISGESSSVHGLSVASSPDLAGLRLVLGPSVLLSLGDFNQEGPTVSGMRLSISLSPRVVKAVGLASEGETLYPEVESINSRCENHQLDSWTELIPLYFKGLRGSHSGFQHTFGWWVFGEESIDDTVPLWCCSLQSAWVYRPPLYWKVSLLLPCSLLKEQW